MLIEIKTGVRKNSNSRGTPPRICVLKCDVCSTVYERSYSYRLHKVHRCSVKCVYGSRSTDGLGGHGAEIVDLKCLVCEAEIKCRKIGNERKWGRTCSKKCYATFRSQHPELYEQNTKLMHTMEVRKKISDSLQENMKQLGWVSHWKGRKHSEESIQRMQATHRANPPTGSKNGMYGRKHTQASKEAMSDKHADLIIRKIVRPYGKNNKRGSYYSSKMNSTLFYRSNWELAYMKYLDDQTSVIEWFHESLKISYVHNHHKRWYIPDFLVSYENDKKFLIEIKPKELVNAEKNVLKSNAAIQWCSENNVDAYVILTGDDLREMKLI